MLIMFPYKTESSTDIYYCCCWKSDYAVYGARIATETDLPKGISDLPEEAIEDFGFIIQLTNNPTEYKMYLKHLALIEKINEAIELKTH